MHAEGADGETLRGRDTHGRTTAELGTERRGRREGWDTGSEPILGVPPSLAFEAMRTPRARREAYVTVALERRGSRPFVEVREDHARRTRPGAPDVPPWGESWCRSFGRRSEWNAIQAIARRF